MGFNYHVIANEIIGKETYPLVRAYLVEDSISTDNKAVVSAIIGIAPDSDLLLMRAGDFTEKQRYEQAINDYLDLSDVKDTTTITGDELDLLLEGEVKIELSKVGDNTIINLLPAKTAEEVQTEHAYSKRYAAAVS